MAPTISMSAAVTCCVHTSSHFRASVQSSSHLTLTAQVSHGIGWSYPLGQIRFDPLVFDVAGVPVVLIPTLQLSLTAAGTVTVGVVTSAGETDTYGVDLTTTDGAVTATPINSHRTSFSPPTLFDQVTGLSGPGAPATPVSWGTAPPQTAAHRSR